MLVLTFYKLIVGGAYFVYTEADKEATWIFDMESCDYISLGLRPLYGELC